MARGISREPFEVSQYEPIPVVIVEGFLGGAGAIVWGSFDKHLNSSDQDGGACRRTVFADVGPVSSLHDRACELFYAIVGGTVDYGDQHSLSNGHLRYGRTIDEGLYPQWSRRRPLHFVGHSMGGSTIIKMQWLMKIGFFGDHCHPDMILSCTTISSPLRGTQFVYSLGEKVDEAPAVRPFSVGSVLAKIVHVVSFLSPLLPCTLDLHSESRSLSCRSVSISSLWRQMLKSDWAESRDATPFDMTFQAAEEREARMEGLPNRETFYRSFVACMTDDEKASGGVPGLLSGCSLSPLHLCARLVGSFDFSSLRPVPRIIPRSYTDGEVSGFRDTTNTVISMKKTSGKYRENDGVVPLFSQYHPLECSVIHCHHRSFAAESESHRVMPVPGVWEVIIMGQTTHCSIVPFWRGTARQKVFWQEMGRWLRSIDKRHFAQDIDHFVAM